MTRRLRRKSDREIIVKVDPSDTNWFVTARNQRKNLRKLLLGPEITAPYRDLEKEVTAFRGWGLAFDGNKFSLISPQSPFSEEIWLPGKTTTAWCYNRYLHSNKSNKTRTCINNVGHPILLDALSNMGFASLMMSAIIPMAQIGGLMVFAMFACSFGTLTLLASSIELFKHKL